MEESEQSLPCSSCSQSLGDCSYSSSISSVDDDDGSPYMEGFDIPDLPRLSDASLGVLSSGGFTQMKEMRQVFAKALEEWFQETIEYAPDDSPTLANFLWEPLSATSLESQHSGLTKLGTIQEI